jgi:inner membrane protein involved in colicin E2 resistance
MSKIKNNLYFKIGGIVLIALLLLIPTGMIKSIIYERKERLSTKSVKNGAANKPCRALYSPFLTRAMSKKSTKRMAKKN